MSQGLWGPEQSHWFPLLKVGSVGDNCYSAIDYSGHFNSSLPLTH